MDAKLSLLHTVQVPGVEMTWADQRSLEQQHVWCGHRCLFWCTCSVWGFRMPTGHLSVSPCSIWICFPRRVKGIERFFHWELFYFSLCLQSCMKTLSHMTLCFLMIFFYALLYIFSIPRVISDSWPSWWVIPKLPDTIAVIFRPAAARSPFLWRTCTGLLRKSRFLALGEM